MSILKYIGSRIVNAYEVPDYYVVQNTDVVLSHDDWQEHNNIAVQTLSVDGISADTQLRLSISSDCDIDVLCFDDAVTFISYNGIPDEDVAIKILYCE